MRRVRQTRPDAAAVLTVNAGSSSLRLARFASAGAEPAARAHAAPPPAASAAYLQRFVPADGGRVEAVVHRVVHGGERLREPCLVDTAVETEIARLAALAPLHNAAALAWIRAARAAFDVPQIAVFDTGFYADLPPHAARYPLPAELCRRLQIRRYGFHGLAHRYMVEYWQRDRGDGTGLGRTVSLQLGSGCSMTAAVDGRAVETSMGFSPLEGLMMATRCGDLDPAVVLRLAGDGAFGLEEIDWILNHESGLIGVAGDSGDMAGLLERDDADARLAVDMFCHRLRKYLGAYLAVLGGAEAILFGGGIGERAPFIRARALEGMAWAGIELDPDRNAAVDAERGGVISAASSRVAVRVVPVREDLLLADLGRGVLRHTAAAPGSAADGP